jgi:hypothetical protein
MIDAYKAGFPVNESPFQTAPKVPNPLSPKPTSSFNKRTVPDKLVIVTIS